MSGEREEHNQGIKKDGTPYKVLLVDDSVFIRKQLAQILTSEGYEIAGQANDGVEGVELYKKLAPNVDMVTMDITMPNLDGISALEQILEFDQKAKVIMITALGKEELVRKSLMIGAKNYIVKPLDRNKVLDRIISALTK